MNRFLNRHDPLSNVDAAWLRMEEPTNLMMVTGILTFDEPLDFEHLKAVIRHRWLRFDRFRQRIGYSRLPVGSPHWEPDPNFNIDAHVHRVGLPQPGDRAALQQMVSDLMSTPLDFSKPLWHFHYIENYGAGSALFARIHHCIADGMALMFVLLAMTDMIPDAPPPTGEPETERPSRSRLSALYEQATSAVQSARQMTGRIIQEGVETISNPSRVVDLARVSGSSAATLAKLTLRWPDPPTVFKGELGVSKRAAWSQPILLRDVKSVRKVLDGTVNDVLLTAMSGALRRYMVDRGEKTDGLNFRAAVPVNLRQPEEMGELGNKFGLVFLSLPVGIADPIQRLRVLKQRMDAIKDSPEAVVAFGVLNAIGMSPAEIQRIVVNIFGTKITAVMTNVPGPPIPLYLAGREIKDIMFWVPQSGRAGLGVSIISYNNQVVLGVATDAGLVPDPERIIDHFHAEFEALLALVRQADAPASSPPAAPAEPAPAAGQCQATTKAGRRCRNKALPDAAYCHVHAPQPPP